MKGIVKTILGCLFLSLGFSGLTGITAFAAAERIDNARITFSYDQAPKAGEAPGTVAAATTSREFTVESAAYANDAARWSLGDRPEVPVILNAADGIPLLLYFFQPFQAQRLRCPVPKGQGFGRRKQPPAGSLLKAGGGQARTGPVPGVGRLLRHVG